MHVEHNGDISARHQSQRTNRFFLACHSQCRCIFRDRNHRRTDLGRILIAIVSINYHTKNKVSHS
jgi:transposase